MKQNIDIFNFSLTSEDKEQIVTLQTSGSHFFDHDDPKTVDFFEKVVSLVVVLINKLIVTINFYMVLYLNL